MAQSDTNKEDLRSNGNNNERAAVYLNTLNSYSRNRPVYSHCSLPVAPLKLVHLYINELNLSPGKTAQRVTIPFCSLHTRLKSRHFPPQIPRPLRSSRPLVHLETGDSVV